jgi:hypothetical protein
MNLKKKLERYLRVNLLGPGPSSYKEIIYRAAVSLRLRKTALYNPQRPDFITEEAMFTARYDLGL